MKNRLLLISVSVLLVTISLSLYLFYLYNQYLPQDIRVTNVTDTSATITWQTKKSTISKLKYSNSKTSLFSKSINTKTTDHDDRSTDDSSIKYHNHSITISDLEQESDYYFKVWNGLFFTAPSKQFAKNFTAFNENKIELFETSEDIITPATSYGKVTYENTHDKTECYKESIVFFQPEQSYPISARVNFEGGWVVDFSGCRKIDGSLTQFTGIIDNTKIYIDGNSCGCSEKLIDSININSFYKEVVISKK